MVASLRLMPGGCSRAAQIASASPESGSPMLIWRSMDACIAAGSAPLEPSPQLGAGPAIAKPKTITRQKVGPGGGKGGGAPKAAAAKPLVKKKEAMEPKWKVRPSLAHSRSVTRVHRHVTARTTSWGYFCTASTAQHFRQRRL